MTPSTIAVTMNDAPITVKRTLLWFIKAPRYVDTEASWRSVSEWGYKDITALVTQTIHTPSTMAKAFSLVFQVKYFRFSAIARKAFPSSTNMETTFRNIKRRSRKSEIIASVFPVNHLTFKTPQSMYKGPLMSALEKSTNARLEIRMFGKVRSFLKRAMIPRTKPLPSTAKIATNYSNTSAKIVMEEKSSTSMIFLAHLTLSAPSVAICIKEQQWCLRSPMCSWRFPFG